MPTYQYRCQTCSHEFEEKQSFADDALTDCPIGACKGAVKKVFSGVGISFKGDGFYKNDHGSNSKKKPQESNSKETSKDTKDTKDTKENSKKKSDSSSEKANTGSSKKETKPSKKSSSSST